MGNPIKVFLVDDHLLFRMGLKSALSDSGDRFVVTGEAASGAELLEHLPTLDADVVILDEASAFADPECEAQVQLAFQEMAKGRTVIMIAHRLSTIRIADRIYVLKDGRVDEQGKHDELLQKNGLYAAMWAEYQKAVNWKVGEMA